MRGPCWWGVAVVLGAAAAAAAAQGYPLRPLRLIVPYAAGGSTDVLARVVAAPLGERLGQQVVVDNRTGAGTLIGTEIVARAAADGHTLLMATPPLVINPSLYPKVPYDAARDFVAVTNVAGTSNVLVVHPSVPAQGVKAFIALLKASPGKLQYGSSGIGGASHLAMELFRSMAGVEMVHVPYKGGSAAINDLIAGQIMAAMGNLTTVQGHARTGRLRMLAIGTRTRSALFPELPTLAEAGVPGYEANNWNGIVVPAGTARAVVERLHREIVAIVDAPGMRERLGQQGFDPIVDTPAGFDAYLRSEQAKWARVVKASGAKAE